MTNSNALVARYYDRVQWLYNLGWSPGGTRSLHYGIWWDDTRTLAEAITNGDRFIAEKLQVCEADHVLDMGCGVGGTSVYLAKTFGCRVTGVTVSQVQLEQATRYAASSGVSHLVRFELMDYAATNFPAGTFTKAFTQESANYADDKRMLIAEAYRVLARDGRYVSLDAFKRREPRLSEQNSFRSVMRGWACVALESFDRYRELASQVGFAVADSGDVTARVTRSARVIWARHVWLYPFAYLGWRIGCVPAEVLWHFQASMDQKAMYCSSDNLLMFGYLVATKSR